MNINTLSKPMVEGTAQDSGQTTHGFCDEYCYSCRQITYSIPSNRVSLCVHCGAELFPCTDCNDPCDWSNDNMECHLFEHSQEYKTDRRDKK